MILREALEGRGDEQLLLPADGMLARRRLRGCRIEGPGRRAVVSTVERDLASGVALRRSPPALRLVEGVVNDDPLQPREPLAGGFAGEPFEPPVGLEERLLNDVGGVDLRLQPALQMVARGEVDIAAAGIEEPVAGRPVPSSRRLEPAGDLRAALVGRRRRRGGRHGGTASADIAGHASLPITTDRPPAGPAAKHCGHPSRYHAGGAEGDPPGPVGRVQRRSTRGLIV